MKKILLTLCFLWSLTLRAQDYVVTMQGDTLKGLASIADYDYISRVDFVDARNPKSKNHYTAIQLKAVKIDTQTYHPIRTENGYRFMKLVKPGYLALYLGRRVSGAPGATGTGVTYDVQFLVKRDGSMSEVPNIAFKKSIGNFLEDCLEMKKFIEQQDLGKKDLNKIITIYNACIEDQTHKSAVTPLPSLPPGDARLMALTSLRGKLEANQSTGYKDAIDILNDMTNKVKANQPVPNYLQESLKSLLKDAPEYQGDLEKILSLLKGP